MLENLIAFFIAIWQIHVATTGLFFLGHNFTETLIVVTLGSSLGVVICFYLPEIITFGGLFKNPLLLKEHLAKSPPLLFYHKPTNFFKSLLAKVSGRTRGSLLRQMGIFIITIIPIPNFELISIAASRLLKIPYSFQIIIIANLVRVLLVVGGIYYLGEKYCQIF